MPRGQQHERRQRHEAERQEPAEREADEHVGPVLGRGRLVVQCSSTAPDEKKNTSYGVIAAPKSAIA